MQYLWFSIQVTHKEKDCEDDRKLLKCDDVRLIYVIRLRWLYRYSYLTAYFDKETNKFTVAGNPDYKETESINSVQSSLKSQPLWVTLYDYFSSMSLAYIFSFNLYDFKIWKAHVTILILILQKLGLIKYWQPLRTSMNWVTNGILKNLERINFTIKDVILNNFLDFDSNNLKSHFFINDHWVHWVLEG